MYVFVCKEKTPYAVRPGLVGSAEQVGIIERMYREYPQALRLVDPVMGDGGRMYPTYTDELCRATARLADGADVLMPNLTEASLLTGLPYEGQDLDDAQVAELLEALLGMGARHVILKGIDRGDGDLRNFAAGEGLGGTDGRVELKHSKLPYMIHGTGDAFASALCGAVFAGRSLDQAARIAGEFVRSAMAHTQTQPDYERRGVSFELDLNLMTALVDRQE
ncbi:pyridoxine kinase [Bifidobacterium aemilianum]|uniref:Pyridoxine kinase n=1 Tax=Bifidobacterium aemilianum TaxID=2493120 RepID=A0A366K784_9BIFI|nr:bifunctional hydroxymethylpyrimidine kinase/phosphomethylpyrimidine kinase [Bifidobacterium aemilianum]RBP97167.1 pyridoxine kinase [Bifidobacterium aemilianum]